MFRWLVVITAMVAMPLSASNVPCDFENQTLPTCSYNLWDDPERWTVQKAIAAQHGPTTDRTLNTENGHYALFKTLHHGQSVLELSNVNITTASCMKFWLYLSDNQHVSFDVNHLSEDSVGYVYATWKETNITTEQWIHVKTPLNPSRSKPGSESVIWIQAFVRDSNNPNNIMHYVALDDIEFDETPCPEDGNTMQAS